jgi:formylglycine-generating enzyme required for sulfatase activity
MLSILFLSAALSADPTAEQLPLLKTFREEFVGITPGKGDFPASFTMGRAEGGTAAEQPAREVRLMTAFHMAKYEVPQNLWEAVMGSNPSEWKGKRNSVEKLSFGEAEEFCKKATELLRAAKLIEAGQVVRLPSEAEWEYCCRAGTKTVYSFGDDEKDLTQFGWFTGNAAGNDPPVGAKKPNPWGLYDMHGYLWEWCADPWHADYKDAPDGVAPWTKGGEAGRHVARGGSWKDKADRLTSSFRVGLPDSTRDSAVGLRCVLAGK